MKSSRKVLLVMCVTFLVVGLMVPTVAQAGKGAVKIGLYERLGGEDPAGPGSGDKVGFAIANANANGQLIVQVHLDNGTPSLTFDVWVKVNGFHIGTFVTQLATNSKGKGNSHVMLNLADYPPSVGTLDVQVIVKQTTAIVGYATDIEQVPLKK